eukprot:TRINITY_DN2592_c0_g1_i2.p2 TRINITY_DN2592_c0_g1~~TRINITY_DN2592_c0_g1_i2.p2  ORF type:complete len:398 (-),score=101.72 TRINITY_DN2592_c0_g1_i2:142-1335(-)
MDDSKLQPGSDHYYNPKKFFYSPWDSSANHGLGGLLKALKEWKRKRSVPTLFPGIISKSSKESREKQTSDIQVTVIGHSTILIQSGGKNFLTDPIFSERCSMVQFVGPKRYTPPSLTIDELPDIHYCLTSHNHYDHLSAGCASKLQTRFPNMKWCCPLGVKKNLISFGIPEKNIIELDWWDTYNDDIVQVTATPTQHFTGRGIFDRQESLWCGFAVKTHNPTQQSFYFAGDTGYRTVPKDCVGNREKELKLPVCPAFKETGDRCGPFDLALIPIGAYSPRWFMSSVHMNPFDAVCCHKDLKAKQSIGIHWGTFILTDEPVTEPVVMLEEEAALAGLRPSEFVAIRFGDTIGISGEDEKTLSSSFGHEVPYYTSKDMEESTIIQKPGFFGKLFQKKSQ